MKRQCSVQGPCALINILCQSMSNFISCYWYISQYLYCTCPIYIMSFIYVMAWLSFHINTIISWTACHNIYIFSLWPYWFDHFPLQTVKMYFMNLITLWMWLHYIVTIILQAVNALVGKSSFTPQWIFPWASKQ